MGTGKTLADQFVYCINSIQNDKALTSDQALKESIRVSFYLEFARKAIAASNPMAFFDNVDILEGRKPPSPEFLASNSGTVQTSAGGTIDPRLPLPPSNLHIVESTIDPQSVISLPTEKKQAAEELDAVRAQALSARQRLIDQRGDYYTNP
jgi:hypothetical protein